MEEGGVSYYTTFSSDRVVNIPFWKENNSSVITHTCNNLYKMGEVCDICIKTRGNKRKKEHNCIFEKGSYHPMRIYSREYLIRLLGNEKMGLNCERAIFNYCVQHHKNKYKISTNWKSTHFKECYKNKFLSIKFNLENKNNPKLLEKVKNEEIKPIQLPFMTPREMFPEKWEGLHGGMYTIIINQMDDVKDSILKCGKCKQNKVHYYQLQTRSADEPMTTFCTCVNCGNRWKF